MRPMVWYQDTLGKGRKGGDQCMEFIVYGRWSGKGDRLSFLMQKTTVFPGESTLVLYTLRNKHQG
jgi:hypothetical protein